MDDVLFAALARAAESRLGSFDAQDLANTVWAFATVLNMKPVLSFEYYVTVFVPSSIAST